MEREYYLKNKQKILEQTKAYRIKNKDRVKQWDKTYYETQKRKDYLIKWREEHRMSNRDATRRYNQRIKLEVITHYGGGKSACVKCGFNDIRALSIDHIEGKGAEHRKIVGSGVGFYRWLKKHDYPEGFQTLCMNCQSIKRAENKEFSNGKKSPDGYVRNR